ncbi:hypothetical protein LX15_003221 [Streptoalloteichus tenebrarius]|uniref:Uncharacterized protein n=1 Tax=Streptoalloteichus tenebrarius (strain ATCC 17920 / DSM 40477 / JCM 4838 / CBS 697.72 / NBRC 16177 / NCIMB 11028 / NRRL B-12390 / A12253. 1 / ISP 5477) TaxID=1933 RepID=A0ABT1HVG8_STRSD|nr:hypothetical protein [Streptoalloteichus tenebrarius]MCP2259516.1 hypothetical protein [Streptoalloteichus tenebrarius]BFF01403.1 hypothetical protein GCM10020241_30780 [Streptoalloteichus tenebrarius]
MITDRDLERIATAIDDAMRHTSAARPRACWEHVEWLRLKADLLDRLAAAQRSWHGSLSRRAELIRDNAERLADDLTGALTARELEVLPQQGGMARSQAAPRWAEATARAADSAEPE